MLDLNIDNVDQHVNALDKSLDVSCDDDTLLRRKEVTAKLLKDVRMKGSLLYFLSKIDQIG